MSIARLRSRAERDQARRREAEQRQAFGGMDRRVGPEHLEQAWHDVDLDVELVEVADDLERLSVRKLGEGDDDAVDVEGARRSPAGRRPCRGRSGRASPSTRSRGCSSTKPTTLTPYSGCCRSFLATRWPTWPAPTIERVLDVGVALPAEGARVRACDGDESDREHPEERELRKARVREIEDVCQREEEPGPDGEHVEDAEELVDLE